MRAGLRVFIVAAALALVVPSVSWARGGGSMGGRGGFSSGRSSGGGSFGGSSGGSSSSGGGFGGSRSYGGGGPGFFICLGGPSYGPMGGGGDGGCGDPSTLGMVFIILLLVGGYAAFKTIQARRQLKQGGGWTQVGAGEDDGGGAAQVARVTVGFLATEKKLQNDLDELARSGKAGTAAGDAFVVREVAVLMARSQDAMNRVYYEQAGPLGDSVARSKLEEIAMDLRSRFDEETVRADEGGVRAKAAGKASTEVSEFVVVSLVIAYTGPALPKGPVSDSVALVALLRQMGSMGPDRLLGMEVVWDPESPDEALTSQELDLHYSELMPL